MGFNIHVVATGHFHHTRRDVPYGDDWELSWVEEEILSRAGVSAPPSLTGGTAGHVLSAGNRLQQVHMLVDALTLLMARVHRGELNVTIRRSRIYPLPTAGGFRSFNLAGTHPGTFGVNLCGFLAENEMDKWGPVIEILDALVRFETRVLPRVDRSSSVLINITLSD